MAATRATRKKILMRAREILSKRGAWCQGNYAQDRSGAKVSPLSDAAVQFCLVGALARAARDLGYNSAARSDAQWDFERISRDSPVAFNDEAKTKRQVLRAIDKVVAAL